MQVASLHGYLGLAEKSLNGASESQRAKDITRPTVVRSLVSFSKTFGSTTTICGGWQPLTIPKHCAVLAGTCNCLERESLQDPYTYVLIIYVYIYMPYAYTHGLPCCASVARIAVKLSPPKALKRALIWKQEQGRSTTWLPEGDGSAIYSIGNCCTHVLFGSGTSLLYSWSFTS